MDKIEIVKFDTGEAILSIKDLKEEIKSLRTSLEGCDMNGEEFKRTLDALTKAQNTLKDVTKTTVGAMEGSYDHLTQEMAKLKKEWRATTDEIERSRLGKRIAEINSELKDMDSTIGNFQRNVGNYGSAFDDLSVKVGDNTFEFERSNKAAQDIIGSFDVVEGALKAVGIESEVVSGLMDKLSGAMKMTQGFKSVKEGTDAFKTMSTTAKGATTSMAGVSLGLTAAIAGFVAISAAAIALAGNLDKLKNKFREIGEEEKAAKAAAELNAELVKLSSQTAAEKVTRVKQLSDAYKQLGDDMLSKTQFIKDYKTELEGMGIAITDVNDADGVFINNTDAYINAIMARTKADAIRNKAQEDYAKFLEEEAELEKELQDAQAKASSGTPKKTFWQNLGEAIVASSVYEGANVDDVMKLNEEWTDEIAQKNIQAIKDKMAEAKTEAEANLQTLFNKAAEYEKEAGKLLTNSVTVKSPSGNTQSQAEIDAKKIADKITEIQKRLYNFSLNTREKELEDLRLKYEEEKKLLEGNEVAQLILIEEYTKKASDINKKYDDEEAKRRKEAQDELLTDLDNMLGGIQNRMMNTSTTVAIEYDAKSLRLDEEDYTGAIQLEIDKTLELQRIREQAYNEHMEQLKEVMNSGILTAEQQAALQAEYAQMEIEKAQVTADTNNQILYLNKQLVNQQKEDNRQLAQNVVATYTSALSAASNVLSAIQSGIDTTNEEGFEKNKKLQVANATISMLVGITNAIAGLFTTKTGPWDIALAAIQAGSIAAAGGIQIANIKKQKYDKSSGGDTPSVPNINTAALLSTPINYTTEIKGTQTIEEVPDTRVYVVESDITDTVRKVQTIESESTF